MAEISVATSLPEVFRLGEFLGEEMDARGWTSLDVAARMAGDDFGVDALFVEMVLAVDDPSATISVADYRRLEAAFGVSVGFFEKLDAVWRKHPDLLSHYEAPDHLFSDGGAGMTIPTHPIPGRFQALVHPKLNAKMTTRLPRKAAKVFKALLDTVSVRP